MTFKSSDSLQDQEAEGEDCRHRDQYGWASAVDMRLAHQHTERSLRLEVHVRMRWAQWAGGVAPNERAKWAISHSADHRRSSLPPCLSLYNGWPLIASRALSLLEYMLFTSKSEPNANTSRKPALFLEGTDSAPPPCPVHLCHEQTRVFSTPLCMLHTCYTEGGAVTSSPSSLSPHHPAYNALVPLIREHLWSPPLISFIVPHT